MDRPAMAVARALTFAVLCALALLALLGVAARAQDGAVVRATVQIPQAASRVLMLEIGIRMPSAPAEGHPGAAVRLRRADGEAVEIGRLSLMPPPSGDRRFQFDIADAVRRLGLSGRAEIEIEAIDRAGGQAAAPLELAGARVVAR